MQNGRVVCKSASAYVVLEVLDDDPRDTYYVVGHTCEIHNWKLTLPSAIVRGPWPKPGEEVCVNIYLTLAAKEKRRVQQKAREKRQTQSRRKGSVNGD